MSTPLGNNNSSNESPTSALSSYPRAPHPTSVPSDPNLGNYLGVLARQNVRRLLDAYRALAPVCIGGPPDNNARSDNNMQMRNKHMSPEPLPRVDMTNKMSTVLYPNFRNPSSPEPHLHPSFLPHHRHPAPPLHLQFNRNNRHSNEQQPHLAAAAVAAAAAAAAAAASVPQPPPQPPHSSNVYYNAAQFAAAAQQRFQEQNRLYCHLYDRMRQVQGPTAAPQNEAKEDLRRRSQSSGVKRRHTNSDSHLSGEMIRRLREQQKQKSSGKPAETNGSNNSANSDWSNRTFSQANSPELDKHILRLRHNSSPNNVVSHRSSPGNIVAHRSSPDLQQPMLLIRDLGHSGIEETVLDGESIPAFSVGGELRLCLPPILRKSLSEFSYQRICKACEELQIHCAPCSSEQLLALKRGGVLPVTAHQCGLITKSDAERLTSYLRQSCTTSRESSTSPKISCNGDAGSNKESSSQTLRIQHECFGTAKGVLRVSEYNRPGDRCIQCQDCDSQFSPDSFILHVHPSRRENRTCHWGFDPLRWRSYIHLQEESDGRSNIDQKALDDVKSKFDVETKQSTPSSDEPWLKRPKLEDGNNSAFRPWKPQLINNNNGKDEEGKHDINGNGIIDLSRCSPTDFISEIRRVLCVESPRLANGDQDLVFDAFERLANRLADAEVAKDNAIQELNKLRRSYRNLESELEKKQEEMRDLSNMSEKMEEVSKENQEQNKVENGDQVRVGDENERKKSPVQSPKPEINLEKIEEPPAKRNREQSEEEQNSSTEDQKEPIDDSSNA